MEGYVNGSREYITKLEMKALKLAHKEGHTEVCYDSSGSFILTGGSDGKVCIWEGQDDTDTTTVTVGDRIFALAFQGGRFFTATEENTIRIHTFPDGVGDGMVTRFTAPARHMDIAEDGAMLVAGSDDFKVKVMSMEENECTCLYTEHQAPILSVAMDPTREFVASASCDGTVKIWSSLDGSTEKSLSLLSKCSEASQAKSLCRMCWSEDGEFLLIPVNSEVHIYLRSSWEVVGKVSSSDIADEINVMAMCPDGIHVAVGCTKGSVAVFDWQNKKLAEKFSHPKQLAITSVAWNPKNKKELAFCDNMGQLGFAEISAIVEKSSGVQTNGEVFDDLDDDMLVASSSVPGEGGDDIDRVLEDPDEENSIDIGSIKRSLAPYMEDNDDAESMASSKVTDMPPVPVTAPVLPANIFKPTPLQPPFQPGSTPEHLSSRFMVWNTVGIVRQYTSEEENSIDIEFHDTATHHALHVDNNSDFVMADLSTQAVVLASRGDEDNPSKLLCMHFGSWDSCKEWSYQMPAGEEIQSVTVTDTWLAVATASRTLRIFSVGGLQREVFSVPGKIVSLASSGKTLMVVYHKGMGVPGDQYMGVSVIRVCKGMKTALVRDETLPLSPGSRLAWIGFSEEGTPFYMDYEGVVRMLNKQFGYTWWPVANTKDHTKGKSDHYWLVSMSETQQQIRCIPCKGSRYPPTLPRPALAVLPLELPLCDMDSEKSKYEESYQRHHLLAENLKLMGGEESGELFKPVREALMKLFAFAAKAEREFRAVEVCDMMEDQSLLHLAATYATRLKRIQLAERVGKIMHKRQEEAETVANEDDSEEEDTQEVEVRTSSSNRQAEEQSDADDDDMEVAEDDNADSQEQPSTPGPMLKTNIDKECRSKDRSSGRQNPFKIASPAERSGKKGSQVFDKMEKSTPKAAPTFAPLPVSIKKSVKKTSSGQAKLTGFKKGDSTKSKQSDGAKQVKQEVVLSQYSTEETSENEPVKKKVSAFDLWLEENKGDLREEFPELSDEDLSQKAAQAFRALSKEERQVWVQKAKSQTETNSADSSKKRKASTDDVSKQEDTNSTTLLKKHKSGESAADKKTPLSQTTNAKLAKFAKTD
ncbi:WD repeat and HMG-box DNA-binding protein 1 isoform X1 [Aplysia californica]|uniref:WD repeat and HMG-box DNA-binding protein 1 isoform X1 n=2 Tax=Aplysia californica TaxID=6500 RepID=A0ABM0JNK7_APLCA|nr:WD repeat and HMG-box DNA-binding protein 1 isoform X1 [Aplysia californica]